MANRGPGTDLTREMAEYATFASGTQSYVTMVLDCVLERGAWRDRWLPRMKTPGLADRMFANIAVQRELRRRLQIFWTTGEGDAEFMPLVMTSSFDLGMAALDGFLSYRFLYERLFGAAVRPLLPSAFGAAVLMPHHPIERRMTYLATLSEEAIVACNTPIEPAFFPVDVASA